MSGRRKLSDAAIEFIIDSVTRRREIERRLSMFPTNAELAHEFEVSERWIAELVRKKAKVHVKVSAAAPVQQVRKTEGARKYIVYADLSPEQKLKAKARSHANQAVRRGQIAKLPCVKCGSREVEIHHEDYSRPLEIIWLCRPCHMQMHQAQGDLINHSTSLRVNNPE